MYKAMCRIDCPETGIPEYTISLLFWILPIGLILAFLVRRKLLGQIQFRAATWTIILLTPVGFLLDVGFGKLFLCFPCENMSIAEILDIPIEEFIFYITGFWFIVLLYIWGDEYYLKKYNVDDRHYRLFSRLVRRRLGLERRIWLYAAAAGAAILFALIRKVAVPDEAGYPGYAWFLLGFAYLPFLLLWQQVKKFVNRRSLAMTIIVTTLISIIWEVTLALPRGYWNYKQGTMMGICIPVWNNIPIEAVSVWLASSMTVLLYEYLKIFHFGKTSGQGAFSRPLRLAFWKKG
jgi:hypothetical protein